MTKIYLIQLPDLKNHVHINESKLKKIEYISQLTKKTKNIKFIYSADISESNLKNLDIASFKKRHESVYGDYIFKVSVKDALLEIINTCNENFEVDKEYEKLVLDYIAEREALQKEYQNNLSNQKTFIDQYRQQFEEINVLWEKFWDSKCLEFEINVKNSNYPKYKKSLFFRKKNDEQHRIETEAYELKFIKLIEKWGKEASSLPYKLLFQCPYCDTDTEVNLLLAGPGSMMTYGGQNMNTIGADPGYKPTNMSHLREVDKLKPNHKYYWRSILSMKGECPNCKKNIFMDNGIGLNLTPNSFGHCSIYPYDDKKSLMEWCGVWVTFYDYLSLNYDIKTASSGIFLRHEYKEKHPY